MVLLLVMGIALPLWAAMQDESESASAIPDPQVAVGTLVVNSTGDGRDAKPGDGLCADSAGSCTLHAAIGEANATAGTDRIFFNIPGAGPHTIRPGSKLPIITDPVTIDGTTEPDYVDKPVIELDGTNAGAAANGLKVESAHTTIRGLAINRFDDDGIDLDDGTSGAVVEVNFIGSDVNGTTALGNLDGGIDVSESGNNMIGGTTAGAGNLIAGNGSHGIVIKETGAGSNTIQGNIIGSDISGALALGNGRDGIYISSGADHIIGGTAAGAGNLIVDNDDDGIELSSDDGGALVQGNIIGLNAAGTIGSLIVSIDAFGQTDYLVQSYNGFGQLVKEVQKGDATTGNVTTTYTYDSQGRVIMSTLPYTGATALKELGTSYDVLGRPLSVETRDGETNYTYPDWQTVIVTDAQGQTTVYKLDAFGRVTSVTEAGNVTTTYQYLDNTPNPSLVITDPAGNTTTITYDSLGRKVALDDPDMGHWAYSYGPRGNLFTQTDARGVLTTLEYNPVGRLDLKTYTIPGGSDVADTAAVDYTYPSPTQVTMSDGSGNTAWNYDVTGQLLNETKTIDGQTFTTGYQYDGYGRLQTMTYPDGEIVTYGYNEVNQVNQVEGEDVYLASAVYDTLGQPKTWNLGNGVQQTIIYDPNTFRPATASTQNSALQNMVFDFDNVGRLDWWTDDSQGTPQWLDPTYDNLNRLAAIDSNVPFFEQDYGYDAIGNLVDRDGLMFTYDPDDRPHLPGVDSQGTGYAYDDNGNMVGRTLGSGESINYTYDAENRLTSVISSTLSGTITTTFVYDGAGQRVKKIADDGQERVYLDDYIEGIAQASSSTANITNSYADSTHPCLVLNENDAPYFVWSEIGTIWFNRFDDPGFLEPANVSNETGAGTNERPAAAVDGNGIIHVVWVRTNEIPENWTKEIFYSYSADGGFTWSSREDISSLFNIWDYDPMHTSSGGDFAGEQPMLVVDANNNLHVFWTHYFSSGYTDGGDWPVSLHRYRPANGTWSDISLLKYNYAGFGYGNATFTDAVAMPEGEVYVLLGSGYRIWANGNWGDFTTIPNVTGTAEAIAVDDTGTIHLVWANDDTLYHQYKLSDEPDWTTPEVLDNSYYRRPDLAVTANGDLHLTWFRYTGLMYVQHNAVSGWSVPEVVSTDTLGDYGYYDPASCRVVARGNVLHFVYNEMVTHGSNDHLDVFYGMRGVVLEDMVKRYYAGEQQLATRMDDGTLYYHLNDPTGTSLVLVDANGDEAGRILYDGFGMTLTNTLPLTLTGVLASYPDAATGLVHLGGGRWYDPALGRPLQPNPAGGPPTVPQALNRYAVTPVGQPGVAVVATRPDLSVLSLAVGAAKSSVAEILGRSTLGPLGRSVTTVLSEGHTLINVRASRTALGNAQKIIQNWGGRLVEPNELSSLASYQVHDAVFKMGLTEKTAADLIDDAGLPTISKKYRAIVGFNAVDEVVETSRMARFPQLTSFKFGLATDVLLSVGFQLAGDSQDIFLTSGQRIGRVGVAAFGGGLSTAGGYGTAILATGLLCGPGAPVCISAALVGVAGAGATAYVWNNYAQPYIFESFDLNSARNLAPLP